MKVSQATFRTMRLAARSTVTLRHTYNLVDMPVKVAGKSGTAEFGLRDSKGRLPYHSWFVGFVPKNPYKANFDEDGLGARLPRVRLRLADEGQRRHGDREGVPPAALRDQEGLPQPRPPRSRQLLPEQLGTATDARDAGRTEPLHRRDRQVRRSGLARLRPAAHDVRGAARRDRPRHGLHEQHRGGEDPRSRAGPPSRARSCGRASRWSCSSLATTARLPLAQDARVADLLRERRVARVHARDRWRRRRLVALGQRRPADLPVHRARRRSS